MSSMDASLLFWMFFVLTVEPQLFRLTSGPCHFSSLHFHSADCLVPQLPLPINLYHSPAYFCLFSPKSLPNVFLAPPFVPLTKTSARLISICYSDSLRVAFSFPILSSSLIPASAKYEMWAKVKLDVKWSKTHFSISVFRHSTHCNVDCDLWSFERKTWFKGRFWDTLFDFELFC